jgi:hypothetical protein
LKKSEYSKEVADVDECIDGDFEEVDMEDDTDDIPF